ncbi:ABC transporter permease [Spiroplasma endosymbiont of Crioceris asparagi]|uniref:ABC transporter permease n=1 Tax=Spiroplasma endosymbiont of Crioceris asparagi TaxID=3066286 RepID=UPI0030CE74DF
MNKIIKSYIKLFSKTLIETFGTIIFIGFFILICLPLLSCPLQIVAFSNQIEQKTNKWDYSFQVSKMNTENVDFKKNKSNAISIKLLEQSLDYMLTHNGDQFGKYKLKNNIDSQEIQLFSNFPKLPNINTKLKDILNLKFSIEIDNTKKSIIIDESENNKENKDLFKYILLFHVTKNLFDAKINYANDFSKIFKNSYNKLVEGKTKKEKEKINSQFVIKNNEIYENSNDNNIVKSWLEKIGQSYSGDLWAMFTNDVLTQMKIQNSKINNLYNVSSNRDVLNFFSVKRTPQEEKDCFNNLVITKGDYPNKKVEDNDGYFQAAVNQRFLDYHQYKLGQKVEIPINDSGLINSKYNQKLKIQFTSIGYRYQNLSPEQWQLTADYNGANYANIFMQEKDLNNIISEAKNNTNLMFYIKDEADKKLNLLKTKINSKDENFFASNVTSVVYFSDDILFGNVKIANILMIMYSTLFFAMIALAFGFIIYVQKKELSGTRKQMGVFKSIGYSKWSLSVPSTIKIIIIMYVGITFGYLISMPMQVKVFNTQYSKMMVFSIQHVFHSLWFMSILFIALPVFFTIIGYLIILNYLKESPLSLMSDSTTTKTSQKWYKILLILQPYILLFIWFNRLVGKILSRWSWGFKHKLQTAFLAKSKGKFVIIITLYSLMSLALMLEIRMVYAMQTLFYQPYVHLKNSVDHYDNILGPKLNINNDDKDKYGKTSKIDYEYDKIYNINYLNLNGHSTKYLLEHKEDFKDKFDYNFHTHFHLICKALNNTLEDKEISEFINKNNIPNSNDNIVDYIRAWFIACAFFEVEMQNNNTNQSKTSQEWLEYYKNEIENTENINKAKSDVDYIKENKRLPDSDNKKNTLMFMQMDLYDKKIKAFSANDFLTSFNELQRIINKYNKNSKENSLSSIKNKDDSIWDDLPQINLNNSVLLKKVVPLLMKQRSGNNTLCALNGIIFDGKQETMVNSFDLNFDKLGAVHPNLVLTQTKNNDFGNIANTYDLSNKNKKQLKKLLNLGNNGKPIVNEDGSINGIISARLSKWYGAKIGDTVNTFIETKPIKVHVVGIQESSTYEDGIIADADQFWATYASKMIQNHEFIRKFDKNDKNKDINLKNVYSWNRIISNKKQFYGKLSSGISTDNISVGQDSMCISSRFILENEKNFSSNHWFFEFAIGWENDDFNHVEVCNFLVFTLSGKEFNLNLNYSYFIQKLLIKIQIQSSIEIMIFDTVILIFLMIILFIILIKFIIFDSKNIIILLRSFGYRDREINFIILGKYATYSVGSFLLMYFANYMLWKIIENIIWDKAKLVFHTPTVVWMGYLVFALIESIVLLCWLAGEKYIKKLPLSRL